MNEDYHEYNNENVNNKNTNSINTDDDHFFDDTIIQMHSNTNEFANLDVDMNENLARVSDMDACDDNDVVIGMQQRGLTAEWIHNRNVSSNSNNNRNV